jgi:glycine hydroxymethyltransferase
MGKLFDIVRYKTLPDEQGRVDADELLRLVRKARPKILLCGSTSHPRETDYAAFRRAAEEVGAISMADVSHVGGLIAGGALANPFDHGFDVVTTTTHKSLRGPRGGMVLCKREHAERIDKSIFPGLQGGPHMNQVAATALTLQKAQQPEFRDYAVQCVRNAKSLAAALISEGARLVTGGTDTHMLVIDTVESFDLDGRTAERTLDRIAITTNKQVIPDDARPPLRPSGIRLGSPAATTRGMDTGDMRRLAVWIMRALRHHEDLAKLDEIRAEVEAFCHRFPVPGINALMA